MITAEQITQFKSASDENTIIAHILRHEFLSNLKEPILDVGAGVGDIASSAFNDKEAILLDILEFEDYQSNELHKRVKKDFFLLAENAIGPVGTILFCHSLQFLDEFPEKLAFAIQRINPEQCIVVINKNDGLMGWLVEFFLSNCEAANPEVFDRSCLPTTYVVTASVEFSTKVSGETYEDLVSKIEYLMDCKLGKEENARLLRSLQNQLPTPSLQINQEIICFEKSNV